MNLKSIVVTKTIKSFGIMIYKNAFVARLNNDFKSLVITNTYFQGMLMILAYC